MPFSTLSTARDGRTVTRDEVIQRLGLVPLPGEGGYFRQTWVAPECVAGGVLGDRYPRAMTVGTAIYYLVTDAPDGFSALHRLPHRRGLSLLSR